MINYYPGKRKISEHTCFVHNGSYFLATLSVYEGGGIECWGRMDKQKFLEHVATGWITVDVPDGTEVRIGEQDFILNQAKTLKPDGSLMFIHKWITKESFVMDVLDSVDVGIGNKSASELCYEAYVQFLNSNTNENREKLRKAYYDVPEHNRRFVLGDQDLKDRPILAIIGDIHEP